MGRIRSIPNAKNLILDYKNLIKKKKLLYFLNNKKINLEIGCGKGNFIINKAIQFPNENWIGIEKDSTITLKVLRKTKDLKIKNLKFINCNANEINNYFKKEKINNIYLNFSDPWPKKRHIKNRITSPEFLYIFSQVLSPNGKIYIKTDNDILFNYTCDVLKNNNLFKIDIICDDLYKNKELIKNNIQTEYEKKFTNLGKTIKYLEISKIN